jgi:putative Mn2+ efflux pump MntP
MTMGEILFLSFGLAMDAVAVSIACGAILKKPRWNDAVKIGFAFGFFQMLMPVIGWAAGSMFRDFVSGIDHWIAFGLLLLIGARMVAEGVRGAGEGKFFNPLDLHVLLVLSLATSIDALAAGISFAFLKLSIPAAVFMIGLTTFLLSTNAVLIGKKFGHTLEKNARIFGGCVLIGMGLKILWEHLGG